MREFSTILTQGLNNAFEELGFQVSEKYLKSLIENNSKTLTKYKKRIYFPKFSAR